MPLTYQPFAQTPEVDRLSRDLQMNVPDSERIASGLLGLWLAAAAERSRSGIARWALLLAGGVLLYRSHNGHCPVYQRLEINKRHPRLAGS